MGIELDFVLYALSMVVLGIFSGACVALEILSLSTSDRSSEEEDEDSEYVDRLLEDPVRNGIALALARTLAVGFTVVMAVRVGQLHFFGAADRSLLYTALFAAASLFLPLFIAKVLAVRGAERFAAATRVVTYPAALLLRPVAVTAGGVIRRLSPGLLNSLAFQIVPLKQKIEMFGAQNGEPLDEEQKLMESVLDFGDTRVREVMVPRIDIVAVNVATDVNEAIKTIMDAGHSRVPIYEETIDNILGNVYTKDLLRKIIDGEEVSLANVAREPFFVPESKMIDDLLTEFRARKQHLAVVVDEYGGTAGIVTLEDVLEEIVGDIQDEFDKEEALIERLDGDTAVCNAKIHLDDLSEELRVKVADTDDLPNSLGGLLYQMIGRVPRVGDKQQLDGIEFEIQSVERQRIDKVVIRGLSSLDGGAYHNDG
jgi:CBS domain containing-hemolysin-like protein